MNNSEYEYCVRLSPRFVLVLLRWLYFGFIFAIDFSICGQKIIIIIKYCLRLYTVGKLMSEHASLTETFVYINTCVHADWPACLPTYCMGPDTILTSGENLRPCVLGQLLSLV